MTIRAKGRTRPFVQAYVSCALNMGTSKGKNTAVEIMVKFTASVRA